MEDSSTRLCFGHDGHDASWKQWIEALAVSKNGTLDRMLLNLLQQDELFRWHAVALNVVGYAVALVLVLWLSWKFYYTPFVWKRVSETIHIYSLLFLTILNIDCAIFKGSLYEK